MNHELRGPGRHSRLCRNDNAATVRLASMLFSSTLGPSMGWADR